MNKELPHKAPQLHIVISINASWNIFNFRSGLIRALLAAGHRVTALAPEDPYSAKLIEMGCGFHPIQIDNKGTSPTKDIALLQAYKKALTKLSPDLLLAYTIKPNIYGSLAAHSLAIPVINNVSGLGTVFIKKTPITWIVKQLYRLAFRRSKHVFFQNQDDQELFLNAKLVPKKTTSLLSGSGIDLAKFSMPQVSFRNDETAPVFLLIARLLRDKGIVEFVNAARRLNQLHPNARFQLLGFLDADNRTAISKAEVDAWVQEGVIEYLGSTEDVRPHIRAADCVVLPSYREGTPRTLLEAAALGRPLIATDVPGCREVVKDGYNGFLCRVRDADDLAHCMEKIHDLPKSDFEKMAVNSRHLVEAKFDEKIVINEYMKKIDQ